jgi:hypothetical protein
MKYSLTLLACCLAYLLQAGTPSDTKAQTFSNKDNRKISHRVWRSVRIGNVSGKIFYKDRYVITYSYLKAGDKLTYSIYTLEEARQEGLLQP